MDWVWWGTVVLTLAMIFVSIPIMLYGFEARRNDREESHSAIAVRSGWWFAISAACLLPSGLFFLHYGWDHGGNAPFAARFPRADAYWLEFIPASFNPAVRDEFGRNFETSLSVLTVAGGLAALMGLYRLYWQPWRWLREMARDARVRMTSWFALKVVARHFVLTTFWAVVVTLFLKIALQTLLYLLGHAVATAFYLLPFLLGLLVLAAMGSSGRDIYDRHGRKIGRLD
ncbi:MAG: hypothetical protein JJT95_12410 [Pararhodobacter sp.]|nr:hypothetical protein [Pararhodobacter sp.]